MAAVPKTLGECYQELSNFVQEMPFPQGQAARDLLRARSHVPHFFNISTGNLLDAKILDRFVRVAELIYYNINDEATIKRIGMKLHDAHGLRMQQSVFYTFYHLFPQTRGRGGGHVDWLHHVATMKVEKLWDGIGGWRR